MQCYRRERILFHALRRHKTSAVVTAALGRLAGGTSLMGFDSKEKMILLLCADGDGPTGALICVSDTARGNVKAYVQNPVGTAA